LDGGISIRIVVLEIYLDCVDCITIRNRLLRSVPIQARFCATIFVNPTPKPGVQGFDEG
jgi:hypothetical protein